MKSLKFGNKFGKRGDKITLLLSVKFSRVSLLHSAGRQNDSSTSLFFSNAVNGYVTQNSKNRHKSVLISRQFIILQCQQLIFLWNVILKSAADSLERCSRGSDKTAVEISKLNRRVKYIWPIGYLFEAHSPTLRPSNPSRIEVR